MRAFLFLSALALAIPSPLAAQALSPAEAGQIDRLVGEALAETGTPSASIAVVRGGRIVLAKAYGKQSEAGGAADPRQPAPVRRDDRRRHADQQDGPGAA